MTKSCVFWRTSTTMVNISCFPFELNTVFTYLAWERFKTDMRTEQIYTFTTCEGKILKFFLYEESSSAWPSSLLKLPKDWTRERGGSRAKHTKGWRKTWPKIWIGLTLGNNRYIAIIFPLTWENFAVKPILAHRSLAFIGFRVPGLGHLSGLQPVWGSILWAWFLGLESDSQFSLHCQGQEEDIASLYQRGQTINKR